MPQIIIPNDFNEHHGIDDQSEVVLPKGTVIEIKKEAPEGVEATLLSEDMQNEKDLDKLKIFYMRCLPTEEAEKVRQKVKEEEKGH